MRSIFNKRYQRGIQKNRIAYGQFQVRFLSGLLAAAVCIGVATQSGVAFADEFMLVPGDEVRILIPNTRPPSQVLKIDMNGEIDLGTNGKVKVAGVSLEQGEELLKRHLEQYLRSVVGVTMMLSAARRTILITGRVNTPGLVTIESTTDLWQSIEQAGGLAPGADLSRVIIVRDGVEILVNVRAYLTRDSTEPLPVLRAGDTLFVSADPSLSPVESGATAFLGNTALDRKVFVLGAVPAPGLYDRAESMSIITAVNMAGGPQSDADMGNVRILTENDSTIFNLNKAYKKRAIGQKKLPKNGGVVIYIPRLTGGIDSRMGQFINIIGGVRNPGRIAISGPVRLVDAISLAGGPETAAKLKDVHVIKDEGGFTLANEYNVKRYLKRGGPVGRVMVTHGTTIYLGVRNFDVLNTTTQIIGTLATISMTTSLWMSVAQQHRESGSGETVVIQGPDE